MRNLLFTLVILVTGLSTSIASAEQFIAGQNYINLRNPVATQQTDKLEVIEFFWYGCGYCAQLEPAIASWENKLPEDTNFVRVPALFGGIWDVHAQMFFTLQAMDKLPVVHDAIFNALHKQNLKLANLNEIVKFLSSQGIDEQEFRKHWGSFSVKTNMQKAKRLAIAYQISSVPSLVVNGKYSFDIGSAGGLVETTELANFLLDKERAQ